MKQKIPSNINRPINRFRFTVTAIRGLSLMVAVPGCAKCGVAWSTVKTWEAQKKLVKHQNTFRNLFLKNFIKASKLRIIQSTSMCQMLLTSCVNEESSSLLPPWASPSCPPVPNSSSSCSKTFSWAAPFPVRHRARRQHEIKSPFLSSPTPFALPQFLRFRSAAAAVVRFRSGPALPRCRIAVLRWALKEIQEEFISSWWKELEGSSNLFWNLFLRPTLE